MLLHLSREMTGAGQNDLENTSGWRLLATGAICYGRADDPRQAIFRSAMVTLHALRTSGFRAVTVTVTVQRCSAEARLRGPGLRPDELVAEQDGPVTEDAAGDLPVLLRRPASRAGAGTPGRPLGRAGNDGGVTPWPGR
jgi:hypothetical protein